MTKQELRALIKEKRAKISPEEKKQRDAAIRARILASPVFLEASSLLIYAPREQEINLLPLCRAAWERGIPVGFPRCDTATSTLQFCCLEPNGRLVKGAYGIYEPPIDAPPCPIDAHTLCILPGLTFDPTGGRLGYGKGYYDRFLATFPGVRAAAIYESLLVKHVPTEPHDRPVALLFTEHECWDCRKAPPAPPKKARFSIKRALRPAAERLYNYLSKKQEQKESKTRALVSTSDAQEIPQKPLHAPAILVCAVYLLLLLSRLIDTGVTHPIWSSILVILLQLAVFLAPALLYILKFSPRGFWKRLMLKPPRTSHLLFLLWMLGVMISGSLLTEIMTGGISSLTGSFTLYDTFVAGSTGGARIIFLIVAYCLLPALCEELVFRGILCTEYRRFGTVISVAVSALFFAMLHFSLPLLLTYLFLGVLLACVRYTTYSLWSTVILHALYNLFCLLGQPYLSAFYVNAGSNDIFLFCLISIFLVFSAFAAGEARKIYHVYAQKNTHRTPAIVPWKQLPRQVLTALFSPAVAACLAIFLIMAIVNLVK